MEITPKDIKKLVEKTMNIKDLKAKKGTTIIQMQGLFTAVFVLISYYFVVHKKG